MKRLALSTMIACFAVSALVHAGQIEWIRRGTAYIHIKSPDTVTITVQKRFCPAPYLYLYGPDGDCISRRPVTADDTELRLPLDAGPGTYRLLLSAEPVWSASTEHSPVILRPEREWTGLHQTDDVPRKYYFSVTEGTDSFTLHATNHNGSGGAPGVVKLYDPGGEMAKEVRLDAISPVTLMERIGAANKREAELKYRILTRRINITDPTPGTWSVEGYCVKSADDIGFWLDGVPNFCAMNAEDLFEPTFPPAEATVTVRADSAVGPTGDPSVICGFNRGDQTLPIVQDLRMKAVTDYCSQYWRERENDDNDPDHINWEGFDFDAEDRRTDYLDRGGFTGLTHIQFSPPGWIGKAGSDVWMSNLDEVGEFVAAYITYYRSRRPSGRKYFTFINEPNLAFGSDTTARDRYIESYLAAGRRLRQVRDPAVTSAKLGGPDVAISIYHQPWDWISALLDAADEYVDFVSYDVYAYRLLDETWRYADDIRRVRQIIRDHDTDGQDEEILIFETNLKGGLYLQSSLQDTHYSAVWWASVLNHALGTGDIRAITYFTLVERGARRKGLLREDGTPKPVYYAMQIYNENLLPQVIEAETSHAQVDCLATRDTESARLNIFLVNRSRRSVDLSDLSVHVPGIEGAVNLVTQRFTGDVSGPHTAEEKEISFVEGVLKHTDTLVPRSITVYKLSRP
ncbi:MAG: hypothetical protein ACLFWB_12715, partial [Armatimonadota bacterium]